MENLQRIIPLYYHGDRIDYIPFNSILINEVINLIINYINQLGLTGVVNIAFIDQQRNPIIIIKYPSSKTIVKSTNYDSIEKIVLIVNDEFAKEDINELNNTNDKRIIYYELTSSYGHPPVYGLNVANASKNPEDIITTKNGGTFYLVLSDNLQRKYECRTFIDGELHRTLRKLNIPPPEVDEATVRKELRLERIDLNRFNPEQIEDLIYSSKWSMYRYSKEELCTILKETLENIGHII